MIWSLFTNNGKSYVYRQAPKLGNTRRGFEPK